MALTAVHRIKADEVEKFLSVLDSFDIIVTQPVVAGYRDNIGIDNDNIRKRLRSGQKLVLIPNLHFEGFFPTWGYMKYNNINLRGKMPEGSLPKCASEGVFAKLRKMDYQCFLLLCSWFHGLSVEKTVSLLQANFDSRFVNAWYSDSLAEFAERELICDTSLTLVINNIATQSEYFFHSFNHPNKALMTLLAEQVLNVIQDKLNDKALLGSTSVSASLNRTFGLPDKLDGIQLPVYPFVSTSLGLENKRNIALKIEDSLFSTTEFVEHYFNYFECLGEPGLSVNRNHKKYIFCEKLIFASMN